MQRTPNICEIVVQITRAYIIRAEDDLSPAYCCKCGNDRPVDQFYKHSVRSDGAVRYRPYCKACRIVKVKKNRSRPIHTTIISSGAQCCKFCGEEKPLEEFYSNGCFSDGVKKYRARCKSCVLNVAKTKHPETHKIKSQNRSASPRAFISSILYHATNRKQDLGFNLDLDYLVKIFEEQSGCCAISGIEMTYLAGSGRTLTNISIDRIDSSRGYLRGNVQLVCDIVNRMKSNMTQEELLFWCEKILRKSHEV